MASEEFRRLARSNKRVPERPVYRHPEKKPGRPLATENPYFPFYEVGPSNREYVVRDEPSVLGRVQAKELERRRLESQLHDSRAGQRLSIYKSRTEARMRLDELQDERSRLKWMLDEEERPAERMKLKQQLKLNELSLKAKKEEMKSYRVKRLGLGSISAPPTSGYRNIRDKIAKLQNAFDRLDSAERMSFPYDKGIGGIGTRSFNIPEPHINDPWKSVDINKGLPDFDKSYRKKRYKKRYYGKKRYRYKNFKKHKNRRYKKPYKRYRRR